MRYTYGHGEIAANRLEHLARVFDPHSSRFIKAQLARQRKLVFDPRPARAIDLGCGPGFTTRLLARSSRAASTCGLDASGEFVSEARRRFGEFEFLEHDLTETPFPVEGSIMYCRFLLSHLPDPVNLINLWTSQLPKGGLFMAEEVEAIETETKAFTSYLEINRGLVASQGASLFVGGELERGEFYGRVIQNAPFSLPVANADAAAMFFPNTISVWEREKYVTQAIASEERRRISRQLEEMIESSDPRTDIVWTMRRIVIQV